MTTTVQTSTSTWSLDATHSDVGFAVRHMMISTVKGRFADVEGTLDLDLDRGELDIDVRIDAASLDTRVEKRDRHLRSPDFFDVERFPTLTFTSRRTEGWTGEPGSAFTVLGDLTIKGVTRQVALDVTFEGRGTDPWGGERLGFTARTGIDRTDFGLTWNQALEAGGVLVAPEVELSLEVQWVKQEG